jgi:membrane-associated phospholipid phosphatase
MRMRSLSERRLAWTVPAAAALLAAVLLLTGANTVVFHAINAAGAKGATLWSSATVMGDALFVLALFLPFSARRPDILWTGIVAALIATFFSHLFKELFDAARPAGVLELGAFHIIGPVLKKGAFPSGHATAAFAFAGVIALSMPRLRVVAPALVVACLVALSRVVVGAHWPMDVLGGAVVGWLSAWAAVTLARRWTWGLHRWPQVVLVLFYFGCAIALYDYDTGYPLGLAMQRAASAGCILFTVGSLFMYTPPTELSRVAANQGAGGGLLAGVLAAVGVLLSGRRRRGN